MKTIEYRGGYSCRASEFLMEVNEMESNEFVPIMLSHYVRLLDGTPYGLIVNKIHEPVGVFVVIYGLEAFRKHCHIPDKNSWLTLYQIEERRQEIVGECGRWEDIPLIARDNAWL